jgi:NAD-dependent dihydropyrimidine dehydrogenase PreA subunit
VPYVIGAGCIDELAGDCVDACPVDCIYEGDRKRYINPDECIECGACKPACPVSAITAGPEAESLWIEDTRQFFYEPLPGRDEAIGSPGGADGFGLVGVDTDTVREVRTTA